MTGLLVGALSDWATPSHEKMFSMAGHQACFVTGLLHEVILRMGDQNRLGRKTVLRGGRCKSLR